MIRACLVGLCVEIAQLHAVVATEADLQKLRAILVEFDDDCEVFLGDPGDEDERARLKRQQRAARRWLRVLDRGLVPAKRPARRNPRMGRAT